MRNDIDTDDKSTLRTLFILLFCWNIMDWVSTYLSLSVWATEYNPFYYWLLQGNIYLFLVFKIFGILIYMALISMLYDRYKEYYIAIYTFVLMLTGHFFWLAYHNIGVFLSMK